jgi:hypothetical protein
MTDSDITISLNEVVTNLVKSSIAQAQKSHQAYIEMSEKMLAGSGILEDGSFNQKALEVVKHEMNESLDHALKILDATTEDEALKLHDEFVSAQSAKMAMRVAELQAMAKDVEKEPVSEAEPVADISNSEQSSTEFNIATAAVAAVSSAGIAGVALTSDDEMIVSDQDVVLETSEVGSNQIAAETEDSSVGTSEDALLETAPTEQSVAEDVEPVSDELIEEEIESLAVKIHEAKNNEAGNLEVLEVDEETITEVAEAADETLDVTEVVEVISEAPVIAEVPEVFVEAPVIAEVPETAVEAPVVAEVPEVFVEAPVVAEVPEVFVEASVVAEVPEVSVEASVVAEVPEVSVEAPVVAEVPEVSVEAPVVAEVPEVFVEAPVVAEVSEVSAEVQEIPEINVEAPAQSETAAAAAAEIRIIPEVTVAGPDAVQVPEKVAESPAVVQETAGETESFDTDLSARLDAVRAMLQGSV